ncbi:hypothetical protein CICLE_v10023151mg [Citrus x clementina]|uniref:Uncharacterized protein n=1 Tax=Citrus clementina TaxID=85681 RepID=V4T8I2_CITCL|nr:hypothetical protein CICLE_v10023151mg [Citrus x clementina]
MGEAIERRLAIENRVQISNGFKKLISGIKKGDFGKLLPTIWGHAILGNLKLMTGIFHSESIMEVAMASQNVHQRGDRT